MSSARYFCKSGFPRTFLMHWIANRSSHRCSRLMARSLGSAILSETKQTPLLVQYLPPHIRKNVSTNLLGTSLINKAASVRTMATQPTQPSPEETDFNKIRRFEDANPERIHGVQVNPNGLGSKVLPGNLVYKHYKWTGNTRKVPLELVHGYFWMVNDLKTTDGKPTLSNKSLIPADEAQTFPILTGLETLSRVTTDVPYYFIANGDAKCTLVNISFRDSGYKNIDSWTKPFEEAFDGDSAVATVNISITERRSLFWLRGTLANLMRKNTPPRDHDKTLLYFGSEGVDDFRDILRMHNIMTNFCFLIDDLGRIRFAGSGTATPEDIQLTIQFAKKLSAQIDSKGRGYPSTRRNKR